MACSTAVHSIHVEANASVGEDVVVRVTGPDEPLTLKRKGKKFGFLWMNVGEVHYEAVPTIYILRSSRRLDEISTPEILHRLKIGFDALQERISVGAEDSARELTGELVKLKEKDGLFSYEPGSVAFHPLGNEQQRAVTDFLLPAKAPVGEYVVDVFRFQNSEGELLNSARLRLQRASTVSFITSLVVEHGLLYGCLAVAIAILAGLSTGFIFGLGRGGSH